MKIIFDLIFHGTFICIDTGMLSKENVYSKGCVIVLLLLGPRILLSMQLLKIIAKQFNEIIKNDMAKNNAII